MSEDKVVVNPDAVVGAVASSGSFLSRLEGELEDKVVEVKNKIKADVLDIVDEIEGYAHHVAEEASEGFSAAIAKARALF